MLCGGGFPVAGPRSKWSKCCACCSAVWVGVGEDDVDTRD